MASDSSIQSAATRALRAPFGRAVDQRGYVKTPEENLVPNVCLSQFAEDLLEGDGGELRMKFCATHSSSALAVNCFAWFRHPTAFKYLHMFGKNDAQVIRFERQFRIFQRGRTPNLDVWIEKESTNIAIESKLTEYLKPKKPKFSEAYDRLVDLSEQCWWDVYKDAKASGSRYLDIAQLVKHYFGLRKNQQECSGPSGLIFLYLYWEPLNWKQIDQCIAHRTELQTLKKAVKDSEIQFLSMTYSELWTSWDGIPELADHIGNLRRRYEVTISPPSSGLIRARAISI